MSDPLPPLTAEERQRITEFAVKAEAYCELIENHEQFTLIEFVIRCSELIAWLYQAALGLREIDWCDENRQIQPEHMTKAMYDALRAKLGIYDLRFIVMEPYQEEKEHACFKSPLWDDFADIRYDLYKGLIPFEVGGDCDLRYAAREWWGFFEIHWGQHAVLALSALYEIMHLELHKEWLARIEAERDAEELEENDSDD
jgi:hypothetical protein